jgi:MYXO-CTERM domain-containing protein
VNGTISGPEEDGVVYDRTPFDLGNHACSGTLVAKNLVATAQHCVSNFSDLPFTCSSDGELVSSGDGGEMGSLVEPGSIEVRVGGTVNPVTTPAKAFGARTFAPHTTTICVNDIAFLLLDRELEGVPLSPVRLSGSLVPGDSLRVSGYGADETMESVGTRHTRTDLRVARVGDNPFRPEGETVPPRTFLTEGPALCSGDSGGPAFAESGALVGVFSIVDGDCVSARAKNVFTQLSPFAADHLGPAFEAAGATPIVEPGSSGGSAGTAGDAGGALGEAGEGGAPPAAGGSGGGAGASGAGTGGSIAGGSAGGNAGTADAAGRRGLRQKGGCRCDVPGGGRSEGSAVVPLGALLGIALIRRRIAPRRT